MKSYMRLKEKFHVGPSEQESASDPGPQICSEHSHLMQESNIAIRLYCNMAGHFEQPQVQQSQPERMKDGKKN
jgi:hypothetical protein